MTTDIKHADDNFEGLYVVGVRLWPDSHDADAYALVLYNEVARNDANRPLTHNGRVVFFKKLQHAADALKLGDIAFRKYGTPPGDVAVVYDVPKTLRLIEAEHQDDEAILADFINELLDFVASIRRPLPPGYRSVLHALADKTTFEKDFGDTLDRVAETRSEARDALLWCLGAVLSSALVID